MIGDHGQGNRDAVLFGFLGFYTVSYTHLDVYKRQIFLRAVIREGGLPFDVRLGSAGKADGEGGDRDGRG